MADQPAFFDLFRIARDEVLARNGQLSLEAVERDGSDANVLLAGGAAAADEVVTQLAQVEAGLFLDSAVGPVLDRLVFDRYSMVRKPAAAAVGQVQFSTSASNPAAFQIPVGTLVQTPAGTQFAVTTAVTFPASTTGPIFADIRSILAGADQQAKAGSITSIISPIVGQPSDLVVTNELATAGADDAEDDPSLRNRARLFFTTARRGTISALVAGALAIPGVRTASVFEALDAFGRPARFVQLVVSDAFTVSLAMFSSPTPPTYEAQSQLLAATVFAGLEDVRAAGIFVEVIIAQVILQPVTLSLTFVAGADAQFVTSQAVAAAVNYVNELAPGAPFIPGDLVNRLRPIPGLLVTGGEVLSPPGTVVVNPLQVLRTSQQIVTVGNCAC